MKLKYAFLCLLLLALLLTQQAAGLEVRSSIAINGTGIIDREAGAASESTLLGIKYLESFYTKSLGYHNISRIEFVSDFTMVTSDKQNTTLTVDGALAATNVKQEACMRHYGLMSRQSFWTHNDTEVVYAFSADNCSASFDMAQNMSGAGGYRVLVLNSTNYHVKEYIDTARYLGDYELLISNTVGCTVYPGAGMGDWLLCPSDFTRDEYFSYEEP